MTTLVRIATLADAETIAKFNRNLAFETEGRKLNLDELVSATRHVLTQPELGTYWLAERRAELIGQLLLTREWSDWLNKEYWWINSVFVDPQHRRQGVLGTLLEHVRKRAHQAPVAAIRLYVDKNNKKASLSYQRLGFNISDYLILESSVVKTTGDRP